MELRKQRLTSVNRHAQLQQQIYYSITTENILLLQRTQFKLRQTFFSATSLYLHIFTIHLITSFPSPSSIILYIRNVNLASSVKLERNLIHTSTSGRRGCQGSLVICRTIYPQSQPVIRHVRLTRKSAPSAARAANRKLSRPRIVPGGPEPRPRSELTPFGGRGRIMYTTERKTGEGQRQDDRGATRGFLAVFVTNGRSI